MEKRKRGNGDGSVFKRGRRYWIAYFDENGVRRSRSTLSVDRRMAERILRDETDRVEKIRTGMLDPQAERIVEAGQRTIEDSVKSFGGKLRAEGRTELYVRRTEREIREFAKAAGIGTLREITAEKAATYLESLKKKGASARTRQCRITSVKGFTRWAWREAMLPADPLAGLRRPNPETDRRRRRRIMLVDEWRWLAQTTEGAPDRFGMPGTERAMLYAVALQTGLRAGELRSLRRSSLHLGGERPYIVVEAGRTKNRKVARQFIRDTLAESLRQHAARMVPGVSVFSLPDPGDMAAMLREDLADARRAWIEAARHDPNEAAKRRESDFLIPMDSEGRILDFHALRHTCGGWAALGGASPKALQTLLRHSTITLTLDTYGHLMPGEEAETVGRMAGFDDDGTESATGTMDVTADCSSSVCNASTCERSGAPSKATPCEGDETTAIVGSIGKTSGKRDPAQASASGSGNSPAWIRTRDRAIMSRQL